MRFEKTPIAGVYLVEQDRRVDQRGYFARLWCADELREAGLNAKCVQLNAGFSHLKGTLRGMHFQTPPQAEAKLVRCTSGAVFDVVLDLRPDSSTYLQWYGVELSQRNSRALYIPEGCAHGYQTLEADCEIQYHASCPYDAGSATGVRFDDPAFDIQWPLAVTSISDADRNWPDYRPQRREHASCLGGQA